MTPSAPDIEKALLLCAQEPIHIPGAVQHWGSLLAFRESDGVVEYVAANAAQWLGVAPSALPGRRFSDVLPHDIAAAVTDVARDAPERRQSRNSRRAATADGRPAALSAHRRDGLIVVEIESADADDALEHDDEKQAAAFARAVAQAGNIFELAASVAKRAAALTGFDRCMIYRFLPDWTGEVVAETRDDDMTPYLGLRYPAGDVPEQARRLYLSNILRAIPDVDAPVEALLSYPRDGGEAPPLDLTYATLRAVSPIHLQYMRNMEVAATLTGSIIVNGRLWGLIACHHRRPRLTPPGRRPAFIDLAETTAAAIERLEAARAAALSRRVSGRLARIDAIMHRRDDNIALRLLTDDPGLADLAGADGAALAVDGRILTFGLSPGADALRALVARLHDDSAAASGVWRSDGLADEPLTAGIDLAPAAGMLAISVSGPDRPRAVFAAFRGELMREVFWGGDPTKPVLTDGDRLEPRASFVLWRQTVTGHSREWDDDGLDGWLGLRRFFPDGAGETGDLMRRLAADIDKLAQGVDPQDDLVRSCVNAIAQPSIVVRHDADNADGAILTANRAFRAAFHIMSDELEGSSFPDLLRRLGFDPETTTALPPGKFIEASVTTAGIGDRRFLIRHTPLLCVGIGMLHSALSLWSLEDVTDFHRAEAALRAAHQKAEATDKAKSAFIAGISHELRTPLNAIIGFSEMMMEQVFGELGNPRYVSYVEHINTSGKHLLSLVSEVLDMTRIERGAYALHEETFDFAAIFEECRAMAQQPAVKQGVSLSCRVAPGVISMLGDPRAVRQIVLNLMSNAVKFTPAGGAVRCTLDAGGEDGVIVSIADNGVGIDAKHKQKVFDPFFQVEQRADVSAGGLGLGLALVKTLTELHGGFVSLESRKGVGTTVRVQFPLWRLRNPCQPVAHQASASPNL
jgi:light-regulated signal transduction histidine kinase (bacteriophytochrome)